MSDKIPVISTATTTTTSSLTLEQFVNIAKGLTDSQQLIDVIKQVIESPNIYAFSELLELDNMSQLKNSNNEYYNLLKLFAYGTYQDYIANQNQLPKLSTSALNKLRHLSIVTLASKCRTIPYSVLLNELDIKNVRELEDLIIEAFYADILKGKLDQQNNQLEIDFSIGRDVTDEQIDDIVNILTEWCSNCSTSLQSIETQILNANTYKQQQIDLQNNIDNEIINLKKSIKIQTQEVESLNNSKEGDKLSKKSSKTKSGSRTSSATSATKQAQK